MQTKLSKNEKERRKLERQTKKYNETHKLIDGIDHKICSICEEWFPSTEEYFYKNVKNEIDGLQPYCKECASKKSRKWQLDNHEHFLKNKREYNKRSRIENPHRREYDRRHAKEQKESGYTKAYYEKNKEYFMEYQRNRNLHKKHEISDNEWNACKKYFNDSCAYCNLHIDEHYIIYAGKPKKTDLHKEHVDDKGSNKLDNCIPSCQSCNSSKWAFKLEEWYNLENPIFTDDRLNKIHKWLEEDYILYLDK